MLGIIIQARSKSVRLLDKIYLPFGNNGKCMLDVVIARLKPLQMSIFVSVPDNDWKTIKQADKSAVYTFMGSNTTHDNNVLKRILATAQFYNIDEIIRVCADNPCISVEFIRELIGHAVRNPTIDYCTHLTYGIHAMKSQVGFFAEYVKTSALEKLFKDNPTQEELEHVTLGIYNGERDFKCHYIESHISPLFKYSVDEIDDYERVYGLMYDNGIHMKIEDIK